MNLLVTNTHASQTYAIVRALRRYAHKIVATVEDGNRFSARLCQAANSRFVDRRYPVPSPVADWRAGNIKRENTQREEAFVQAMVRTCDEQKIDVIFSFVGSLYLCILQEQGTVRNDGGCHSGS